MNIKNDKLEERGFNIKHRTVGKYFHEMLNWGIYLAPAQFEALFVSTAHTKEDLDKTIKAHKEALETIF